MRILAVEGDGRAKAKERNIALEGFCTGSCFFDGGGFDVPREPGTLYDAVCSQIYQKR